MASNKALAQARLMPLRYCHTGTCGPYASKASLKPLQSRSFSSTEFDDDDDTISHFTHVSSDGKTPKMVDVSDKRVTRRLATARSTIRLPPAVLRELKRMGPKHNDDEEREEELLVGPKGPIGTTAIIAGVLGAKQTSNLIPFCHPLPLDDCQIRIYTVEEDAIEIECQVKVTHKTGVEMEALTGASIAALCVYDMCKALSHDIVIENTRLIQKTGGKRDVLPRDTIGVDRDAR